jgi:hypothetical protein
MHNETLGADGNCHKSPTSSGTRFREKKQKINGQILVLFLSWKLPKFANKIMMDDPLVSEFNRCPAGEAYLLMFGAFCILLSRPMHF